MRFLADMGVSKRVVSWLRAQGHDVVHLSDRGLHRLPDQKIFELAGEESRTVLTFDLDFGEIVAMSRSRAISVILFRLNNTRSSFVIDRLESALRDDHVVLEAGAIITVEDARHRVRPLPIGS
jgi:predicted nuclease of predicted toxin-antitoxin system